MKNAPCTNCVETKVDAEETCELGTQARDRHLRADDLAAVLEVSSSLDFGEGFGPFTQTFKSLATSTAKAAPDEAFRAQLERLAGASRRDAAWSASRRVCILERERERKRV